MPVRVEIIDEAPLVEVISSGDVTNRETGWAIERTRELIDSGDAWAMLVDSRDITEPLAPARWLEVVEDFFLALGRPVQIAYLPARRLEAETLNAVHTLLDEHKADIRVFTSREDALHWLKASPAPV